MFDDPKKELVRLEELLLEEEKDEDFERFYSDIFAEFGADPEDEENAEEPAKSQSAPAKPAPRKNTYADSTRSVPAVKQDRSIRNLGILALLETAGIIALVLWWILRIL